MFCCQHVCYCYLSPTFSDVYYAKPSYVGHRICAFPAQPTALHRSSSYLSNTFPLAVIRAVRLSARWNRFGVNWVGLVAARCFFPGCYCCYCPHRETFGGGVFNIFRPQLRTAMERNEGNKINYAVARHMHTIVSMSATQQQNATPTGFVWLFILFSGFCRRVKSN